MFYKYTILNSIFIYSIFSVGKPPHLRGGGKFVFMHIYNINHMNLKNLHNLFYFFKKETPPQLRGGK